MKLNMKLLMIFGILILILGIAIVYFINNKNNYEIEVTAITSGTDEFGNDLDETKKEYKYIVKTNLVFYETYSYEWTTDDKKASIGKIMTIKRLNKKDAIIETSAGDYTIEYGKRESINSLMFVSDGLNCVYYYKIIRL